MKNRKERMEIYRGLFLTLPKPCLANRVREEMFVENGARKYHLERATSLFEGRLTLWKELFSGDLKKTAKWSPENMRAVSRVETDKEGKSTRVEYLYHEIRDLVKADSLSVEIPGSEDFEKNELTFGIFGLIL